MNSTIGERLRAVREAAGLSASEASVLAGKARTHLSLLESGAIRRPSADVIAAFGRLFGADCDWLITGSGAPPEPEVVRGAVDAAKRAAAA